MKYAFHTIPPGSARVYSAALDQCPTAIASNAYKWGQYNNIRVQTRIKGGCVTVYVGEAVVPREGVAGVNREERGGWRGRFYKNGVRYQQRFKTFEEALAYRKQLEETYL